MAQRGKGEGNIRKRKDGRWEARVTIGYNEKGSAISKSVYGTTRGIEENGALRIETENGQIQIIHAGDVQSLRNI